MKPSMCVNLVVLVVLTTAACVAGWQVNLASAIAISYTCIHPATLRSATYYDCVAHGAPQNAVDTAVKECEYQKRDIQTTCDTCKKRLSTCEAERVEEKNARWWSDFWSTPGRWFKDVLANYTWYHNIMPNILQHGLPYLLCTVFGFGVRGQLAVDSWLQGGNRQQQPARIASHPRRLGLPAASPTVEVIEPEDIAEAVLACARALRGGSARKNGVYGKLAEYGVGGEAADAVYRLVSNKDNLAKCTVEVIVEALTAA